MKIYSICKSALIIIAIGVLQYACTKEPELTVGSIYGTVTDYATGNPIGNVNVKLRPSGETTLTGNDGTYEFKNLKTGNYSLYLSKAEYADLDDDYTIELEAGKSVKRDVQMRKLVASLLITDMAGNNIDTLDFGMDEAVTSKSFNIHNNGTVTINCVLSYNCVWIDTVIAMDTEINPGQTRAVTVVINRDKLSQAENRTYLHIISNNGSNELLITAIGYGSPKVITDEVTSITSNSAVCGGRVVYSGGYEVTSRGLCWSTDNLPSLENGSNQGFGAGIGSFSGMITGLSPNTTYYVRAYAVNQEGVSYGEQRQFSTLNGLPTVTTTPASINDGVVVSGGNVSSDGGYTVTARGICYGTLPYPDLSSTYSHTENGSGTGYFSSTINESMSGTVYIRAYATNVNGTAYGEQIIVEYDYLTLPTFTFNGHTYKVAPDPHTSALDYISWAAADAYCENLTLYGYSDWRMPTVEELETMYQNRSSIGGFVNDGYANNGTMLYYSYYHSSTVCNTSSNGNHYLIEWRTGGRYYDNYTNGLCVNGVDNRYRAHVRPIRIDQ